MKRLCVGIARAGPAPDLSMDECPDFTTQIQAAEHSLAHTVMPLQEEKSTIKRLEVSLSPPHWFVLPAAARA